MPGLCGLDLITFPHFLRGWAFYLPASNFLSPFKIEWYYISLSDTEAPTCGFCPPDIVMDDVEVIETRVNWDRAECTDNSGDPPPPPPASYLVGQTVLCQAIMKSSTPLQMKPGTKTKIVHLELVCQVSIHNPRFAVPRISLARAASYRDCNPHILFLNAHFDVCSGYKLQIAFMLLSFKTIIKLIALVLLCDHVRDPYLK